MEALVGVLIIIFLIVYIMLLSYMYQETRQGRDQTGLNYIGFLLVSPFYLSIEWIKDRYQWLTTPKEEYES